MGVRQGAAVARTSPAKMTARERQHQAVELRKAGSSFDQIAQALGYSNRSAAYKAVTAVLARWDQENTPELIALESARLDHMQRVLATRVLAGELDAIHATLRVMERRAKLLGLDHSEARQADAVEAMAIAYTSQVAWLQTAMAAILARLQLTPEQEAEAPLIIAGYLEEAAANVE